MNYETLLPFATGARQKALLDELITNPQLTITEAGRRVGMLKTNACRAIRNLKKRAESATETRADLYCPDCAEQGMRLLPDKAPNGRKRYECVSCGFTTVKPSYTPRKILPKHRIDEIKKHTRFLITSAVNDTDIVTAAHETFLHVAQDLGACYLVVPGVYKNPDLTHQGAIGHYDWPKEVDPYLCNADIELSESLVVRGGAARIQYTAVNPLGGMNHAGTIQSEIFGHPQVAMELVATAKELMPKMLHTTGSISQKNYGGSKQAHKAGFHHSLSALLVEVEGDKFWTHEVHFDGEGAYVYDKYYTPQYIYEAGEVAGIVYGDTHLRYLETPIAQALDAVSGMLKPRHRVYHDVHDHHIGSHHSEKDVLFHIGSNAAGEYSIRNELNLMAEFLEDKPGAVVVDSNHHQHLSQWFNRFKPTKDPVNVDLYFELGHAACVDIAEGGDGNLLRLFMERYCSTPVTWVGPNELFEIAGIDCSQHGDRGPNGARGSAKSFAKTGHKTVVGHSHTPRIEKGCYQVGTSAEKMDYARGYSSWLNTHCIIYSNGKRGLFSLIEGQLSPLLRELVG